MPHNHTSYVFYQNPAQRADEKGENLTNFDLFTLS